MLALKLSALAEMRTNRAASTALPGSAPSSAMLSSMVSFAAGASVRLARKLYCSYQLSAAMLQLQALREASYHIATPGLA